jgi:RNA polymerase sigma factor (sigma-70 family)
VVFDPYARTVSRLGRLLTEDGPDALPDAELLRRYAAVRDEAAFAALVRRHGPLVFGVCRRVLSHQQDAEDAFQATFLVLARRASGVRGNTLSRWLYGVARRVANKARVRRAKRQPTPADLNAVPAAPDRPSVDWLPLLDSALGRLPDRDRWPILLCDLQGRTRAEAADELGIGEGTLSSRLARAREKLRHKLGRLGVSLSAAGLAAGLTESAAGTVPGVLIETTLAAGSSAAAARDLAEGVMRGMALLTLAKRSTVALGLLAAGVVLVPWAGAEQQPTPKDVPKTEAKPQPRPDSERILGEWVVESVSGKGVGEDVPGKRITFEADRLTAPWLRGRNQTYRLDPSKPVKRIDFALQDVPEGIRHRNVLLEGIYDFADSGKLFLGFGDLDRGGRPTALTGVDSGIGAILLLRRPTELDRLRGHWTMNHGAVQSKPGFRRLDVRGAEFNFGDEYERPIFRATATLDPSKSPKHLDLKLLDAWQGLAKGTVVPAIYDVEGDDLAVAVGLEARPTNFQPTDKVVVTVFERWGRPGPGVKPAAPPKDAEKPATKPILKNGPAANIRHLQEERIKALRTQMEDQFERVKIGKEPLIHLINLHFELTDAEVAVADTKEAKLTAREACVERLRFVEDQLKELQNAGLQTKSGVAQAQAARLKAEIELEKLKPEK